MVAYIEDQLTGCGMQRQSFIEFSVGGGQVLLVATAISLGIVALGRIHGGEPGDLGSGLVLTAARNGRSAAVVFNQGLVCGEVFLVKLDGAFEFLARFFSE